ncbi:MAG: hypothetical protein WAK16_07665, partial [Candidatus Cybelea sp.]
CVAFAYRACSRDAEANEWLARAIALYEAHFPYLNDEQRSIFSALPWHAAMLAAKAGAWPSRAW